MRQTSISSERNLGGKLFIQFIEWYEMFERKPYIEEMTKKQQGNYEFWVSRDNKGIIFRQCSYGKTFAIKCEKKCRSQ